MPSRQTLIILGIAVLLLMAGCAGPLGSTEGGQDGDMTADDASDETTTLEAGDDVAEDAGGARLQFDGEVDADFMEQRDLIRTSEIRLRVDDVQETSREIRSLTAERGGFVSAGEHQVHERHNETWRTERVVIRIPNDAFDETVSDLEAFGEVQKIETETRDVTEELVDLEARLENLRDERDRLRELFEEANETEDVLAVQRELSAVQEEIERLSARQESLQNAVTYSTIAVHLVEEEPDPDLTPADPDWYETSVASAFVQSVNGVILTLRALSVGVAYVAPFAFVFGTPLVGAAGVYWYRRR